jgi:hypothetical protein
MNPSPSTGGCLIPAVPARREFHANHSPGPVKRWPAGRWLLRLVFVIATLGSVFLDAANAQTSLVAMNFRGRNISVPSYLVNTYQAQGATLGHWPTMQVQISPGRTKHTFRQRNQNNVETGYVAPPVLVWEGSSADSFARVDLTYSGTQDGILYDQTADEYLPLFTATTAPTAGTVLDRRHGVWTNAAGTEGREYFLLPAEGQDRPFVLMEPGWTYYQVSKSATAFTASGQQLFEAWSGRTLSASSFCLLDLSAYQTSPASQSNLHGATWTPLDQPAPLVGVTISLEGREAGHVFTVHGSASGAAQEVVRVTAAPGSPHAILSFVLEMGTNFYITRDAEDGGANQPAAPAAGVWTATFGASFSALGCFPAEPARQNALVPRDFLVNARTRPGHEFSVRMSDGYTSTFGPMATAEIGAYQSAQIENWLDNGADNHLPVYSFTALLDPSRTATLRDNTNCTYLGVPADANPVEWLDGWQPLQALPAQGASITLTMPGMRIWQSLQLRRPAPDGWSFTLGSYQSLNIPAPELFPGLDGMAGYSIQFYEATLAQSPGPRDNLRRPKSVEGDRLGPFWQGCTC